ncbi:hypothetical protein OKW24_002890 [Peribacillus simplex]|nr:hypothetical protein [Peribacillus simplex]
MTRTAAAASAAPIGRMAQMKGQSAPHMFPDSQFAIKIHLLAISR